MLTTPGGKSVCSVMSSPSTAAHHGVSGAGFRTTVFPAASAGPILARLIWCGKFHGVIAPTTPTASRAMVRRVGIPIGDASPRSVSTRSSRRYRPRTPDRRPDLPAERSAVSIRGAPTSAMVRSRSSSRCSLHRLTQLAHAPHPQLGVARPVGLVEGPSRRIDGAAHVLGVGIGRGTQHFLGGRVDRRESPLAAARQLAVDEAVSSRRRPATPSRPPPLVRLDTCPE